MTNQHGAAIAREIAPKPTPDPETGRIVTTYAFDRSARSIIAIWSTARGSVAQTVLSFKDPVDEEFVLPLAFWMNELSEAAWEDYTSDLYEEERASFDEVGRLLTRSPDRGRVSYNYVEASAAGVATALEDLLGEKFATHPAAISVATELCADVAAAQGAARGDLSGRATQAVTMSRMGSSPTQVDHAWQILSGELLDCRQKLSSQVEPSAAAEAACAWLHAALHATMDAMATRRGTYPTWQATLDEADANYPVPRVLYEVVSRLEAGDTSPAKVARALIGFARALGTGEFIRARHSDYDHFVAYRQAFVVEGEEPHDNTPMTWLDPRSPAPDLLSNLLTGFHLLYPVWVGEADVESFLTVPNDAPSAEGWFDDENDDHTSLLPSAFQAAVVEQIQNRG